MHEPRTMIRRRRPYPAAPGSQDGIALVTVLAVILIVSLLSVVVMYFTGREIIASRNQRSVNAAFFVADGGATVGKQALLVLVQNLQANANATATGNGTDLPSALSAMYANGQQSAQTPLLLFDYAGFRATASGTCCQQILTGATNTTAQVTYVVDGQDATYTTKWIDLSQGSQDAPVALGNGAYVARIGIKPRLVNNLAIERLPGPPSVPTYIFHFTYDIESVGTAANSTRQVSLSKDFDVVMRAQSFANWVYFNDVFGTRPAVNGWCTPGRGWFDSSYVFDGPAHTNERLWLAYNPTFQDVVEQANWTFTDDATNYCVKSQPPAAGQGLVHFWQNGAQADVNLYCSPDASCSADNPVYGRGSGSFNRLASYIDMPQNVFSQIRASLGGDAFNNTTAVTNKEINSYLGLCQGQGGCPNSAPKPDVYLPHTPSGSPPSLTGGVYIQDDNLSRIALAMDGSGRQVLVFVQSGVPHPGDTQVTSITIDRGANQTIVSKTVTGNDAGATSVTYAGIPNGMVYVSGSVGALGGRDPQTMPSGLSCPADAGDAAYGTLGSCVQQDTALTVTAAGDIGIDNHIRYQTDPRGPDGVWGTADDAVNVKNILGVYTGAGNIHIKNPAPDNIVIDAFLMAGQGEYDVDDFASRPAQGNANILGGKLIRFEGYEGTMYWNGQIASGYGLNLSFDRRTQNGTAIPPFFPFVSQYTAGFCSISAPNVGCLTDKPRWQEKL